MWRNINEEVEEGRNIVVVDGKNLFYTFHAYHSEPAKSIYANGRYWDYIPSFKDFIPVSAKLPNYYRDVLVEVECLDHPVTSNISSSFNKNAGWHFGGSRVVSWYPIQSTDGLNLSPNDWEENDDSNQANKEMYEVSENE